MRGPRPNPSPNHRNLHLTANACSLDHQLRGSNRRGIKPVRALPLRPVPLAVVIAAFAQSTEPTKRIRLGQRQGEGLIAALDCLVFTPEYILCHLSSTTRPRPFRMTSQYQLPFVSLSWWPRARSSVKLSSGQQ
jgi:hypothetical protein